MRKTKAASWVQTSRTARGRVRTRMDAEMMAAMARRKRAHHSTSADRRIWPGDEGDSDSLAQTQAEMVSGGAAPIISVEHRRRRVIALLAEQTPIAEIVAATGYRPRTIRQIAQRYRESGPAGLADGRQRAAGAAPLLSDAQQRELRQALQSP